MDQILDTQTYQDNRPLQYAGFWIRVAAFIIDYIVISVASWIVSAFFIMDFVNSGSMSSLVALYGIITIAYVLYFTVMESSERQGTLGKMAVGIKVGDMHGNKISFGNALGRFFSKIISGLILYIGFMMVGWDDRKQGLHDKIASTYVFYK
jgi:uncharacterized RDD family membrane protein YckC